jgi:hypothetical protein
MDLPPLSLLPVQAHAVVLWKQYGSIGIRSWVQGWIIAASQALARSTTGLRAKMLPLKVPGVSGQARVWVGPEYSDQLDRLKLELACKSSSLYDQPPVPLKHLTQCLRNRVQAIHLQLRSIGSNQSRPAGRTPPTTRYSST